MEPGGQLDGIAAIAAIGVEHGGLMKFQNRPAAIREGKGITSIVGNFQPAAEDESMCRADGGLR